MSIEKVITRNYSRTNVHPASIPSLKEGIEEYLTWKGSYTKAAGRIYKNRLLPFAMFMNENIPISQVTISDIIRYHDYMKEKNYSLKTVQYSGIVLKNFFLFWMGKGIRTLNPIEIRSEKCISPDKELISQKDFDQMNDILDERFFPELTKKLVINLLWDCGMRVSELCDLNISDIQETSKPGIRCAKIRRRKSQRYNIVVWGQQTDRLLNQYLEIRRSLTKEVDALLIASTQYRTRVSTASVQRWVKEVAEKAGIEKTVTPHCFRHSKAHRILDKSDNVRDVQSILGHNSPTSSFHYLSLNRERQLSVSERYL